MITQNRHTAIEHFLNKHNNSTIKNMVNHQLKRRINGNKVMIFVMIAIIVAMIIVSLSSCAPAYVRYAHKTRNPRINVPVY